MKWCWNPSTCNFPFTKWTFLFSVIYLSAITICYGQEPDPVGGIQEATGQVTQYFGVAIYLMYAIGALAGIVGAVKTFNQWNSGDPNTTKTASAWFGSCLFLVVVATVLKTVFGLN